MAWIFGKFELDPDRYLLRRGGDEVHVEPRVFETLAYLVRHRDRVVSKDELVEEVWSSAHVTDATLKRAVQEARRALGDDGERQELIETVYGRGYRFVAEILDRNADRDTAATGSPPSPAKRYTLVAAAIVTVVALAVCPIPPNVQQAEVATPIRLLVLPFDFAGTPEGSWFAVGLTDELTARLAAARDLAVLSRTTAEHHAASDRSLTAIGRDSEVDYVLEGSVRLDGQRVRVTSQLVRVAGDDHVWATTFERRLDDVFAVQAEIAGQVAERLELSLGERARNRLAAPPTDDLEAYRAYVAGCEHLAQGRAPDAVALFRRAVDIDPGFALAWARLGHAHTLFVLANVDTTDERKQAAERAVAKAEELTPDEPLVRLARAIYAQWVLVDYEESLRQLDALLDDTPHVLPALILKSWVLGRLGRAAEANELSELIAELEPRPSILYGAGVSLWVQGRHEEAERLFDEGISQAPGSLSAYLAKAWHLLSWKGDLQAARSVLVTMPEVDEPPAGFATFAWWPVLLAERSYDEALERLEATRPDVLWNQWSHWPKPLLRAQIHRLRGQSDLARAELESIRPELESALEGDLANVLARSRIHGALGLTLAGLGESESAIRHGLEAVQLGGVEVDAQIGRFRLEELAEIYLLSGEPERAVETLETLVSLPSRISPAWLRLDPRWDALRRHPRFERLVASES